MTPPREKNSFARDSEQDRQRLSEQLPESTDESANSAAWPPLKLDLRYLTDPRFGPAMVRRKARRAFELFFFVARGSLEAFGEPFSPTHYQLCQACGLNPDAGHARVTVSRLLRQLRTEFGVINYEPVRRRRPVIRLLPPVPDADLLNPPHYVYLGDVWELSTRGWFDRLGADAFAAKYMYLIATYEAALARTKHGRSYWFFPLEQIAQTFHVSTDFAGCGLRALVEMGVMHVAYGQYGIAPRADEFGRANRYYFEGISAVPRRASALADLEHEFPAEFERAAAWSSALTNGRTVRNVAGLCELIRRHGNGAVEAALRRLETLPRRSLKRRLTYLQAILEGADSQK